MKRYILTLLLAACVCTACDKDDEYEIREWTVASQLGIAHGAQYVAARTARQGQRRHVVACRISGHRGIRFRGGLRIPAPHKSRTTARSRPRTALRSATPCWSKFRRPRRPRSSPTSSSRLFTMEVAPQPMNYRGQRFLGVRFPESGLNEWQPWPFRIEGFEYEPGYVYRLRIGTSVIPAPDSPEGYYTVSLLDARHGQAACRGLNAMETGRKMPTILKTKTTLSGRFFMAGNRSSLRGAPPPPTLPSLAAGGYSPSGSSCTGTPFFRVANERICHVTPMATASRAACAHHQAVSSAKMQ